MLRLRPLLAMDSLPDLHPIVLKHISSPPFKYSVKGLTFRGHARESIADLKFWLFPKRKNAAPLERNKDWWLAQLRLHGIYAIERMTKADMGDALKAALSGGLNGPSEEILQLERELERKFLLKNAVAREKDYASLSEEERVVKYSERYLRERFFEGTSNEKLLVLELHQPFYYDGDEVHDAATKLGLHSVNAFGAQRRKLIIVGKNKVDVQNEFLDWEQEYYEWKKGKRAAKRQEERAAGGI